MSHWLCLLMVLDRFWAGVERVLGGHRHWLCVGFDEFFVLLVDQGLEFSGSGIMGAPTC